jgi:hypothetical protein
MNDEAREVLVAAALRGHRQITGRTHDQHANEGECAMGVLHLRFHETRAEAVRCWLGQAASHPWWGRFRLEAGEIQMIAHRNDNGWDFLTIARKVGTGES